MSEHPSGLPLGDLRDVLLNSDAECLYDAELFTGPADLEDPGERVAREAVAREVCASCAARPACLSYALRVRPADGVWAGFTADELAAFADRGNPPRRDVRASRLARRMSPGHRHDTRPCSGPADSRQAHAGTADPQPITKPMTTADHRVWLAHWRTR